MQSCTNAGMQKCSTGNAVMQKRRKQSKSPARTTLFGRCCPIHLAGRLFRSAKKDEEAREGVDWRTVARRELEDRQREQLTQTGQEVPAANRWKGPQGCVLIRGSEPRRKWM